VVPPPVGGGVVELTVIADELLVEPPAPLQLKL
jgi:hypothetical protein